MRDLERFASTIATLQHPASWVEWLNQVDLAGRGSSDIQVAARAVAQAVASGVALSPRLLVEAKKTFEPALRKAWESVFPYFQTEAQPEGARKLIGPRLWFRDEILGESSLVPLGPEPFHALNLFLFLVAGDRGRGEVSLKQCGLVDCSRFFIDHSRAQKAKFCSANCRAKAFRIAEAK